MHESPDKCGGENCAAHVYVTDAVKKLEEIAGKLADGQQRLQIGFARLTENMEQVRRLHNRIDALQRDLDSLNSLKWRFVGGAIVLMYLGPKLLSLI